MSGTYEGKIGVICTAYPGINPGVATEDLAFEAIRLKRGYKNVEYFRLLPSDYVPDDIEEVDKYHEGFPIKYSNLLESREKLLSSDIIIYWGNWVHMQVYYEGLIYAFQNTPSNADQTIAKQLINSHIFMTDQVKTLEKTISFGETLIFNSIEDEISADYGPAHKHFFSSASAVYVRDIISSKKIQKIRNDYTSNFLSVDCAMLLDDEFTDTLPRNISDENIQYYQGKVAVFFGRSRLDDGLILEIVDRLCTAVGASPCWLSWGSSSAFYQLKSYLFSDYDKEMGSHKLKIGDQLKIIGRSKFVITDTYHVCVNAWRMGVPAICIAGPMISSDFDDSFGKRFSPIDKRYVLYAMLEALDFFIHAEELDNKDCLADHISHIVRLLGNRKVIDGIHYGVKNDAALSEDNLCRAIYKIAGIKPISSEN